ncbi:hypothetical protein [Thalassospira lucentensis]|uniref:hypothetical protein n=1 Tax=Thalassospira lucentensis TaxID=168935 RepID=UPI003D2B2C82
MQMLAGWRKLLSKRLFMTFFAVALIAGCGSSDDDYKIIKDEKMGSIKRTVEIELIERVDEKRLREIATNVYEKGFERTFIGYRVKGENRPTYWATTHYNPNLEVKILAKSLPDKEAMETDFDQGSVLGSWTVHYGFEYIVTFVEVDGKININSKFADGSSSNYTAIIEVINGQQRYYTESSKDHGEYYVISESGDLEMWSPNGNYYTAKRKGI